MIMWIAIVLCTVLAAFFLVRAIGKLHYLRTPAGGINESMYIDVNGTKQWINIYGKDRDNPVLLYLHGGPGSATSHLDYAFTRKWTDVYTVVTWDQRQCGKSYDPAQNDIRLTKELLLADGKAVTEHVLDYLAKEKLTVLGHSWGSIFGANLVLEYPEYYECFIGTGQLVDHTENEEAFIQEALKWAENDGEMLSLIRSLNPAKPDIEYYNTRNRILDRYGYGMMARGADYPLIPTIIFNPNYTLRDWARYLNTKMDVYFDFLASEEFTGFSLTGKTEYHVPYYNINGDRDYQTNYQLAQTYFDKISAPHKQMFIMENMTHGLLESDSEGFSGIVHQIFEIERERRVNAAGS